MNIICINPIEDKRWIQFISTHPESTIFHHPNWLKVLNRQYGFKVFAVCTIDEKENITSGIPFCEVYSLTHKKKWISLPFSDYCNPLYNTERDIFDLLRSLKVNYKMHEVKALEINYPTLKQSDFYLLRNSYIHLIDIAKDENTMMKTFDRTKRQGIVKAQKLGLEVVLSREYTEVLRFFNLHLITRRSKGIPIQPKSFFHRIHEHLIKENLGFTIIVKKDNVDIAAGLFMNYNGVLTYKYNASRVEYQQYRPNNLIVWRAIQEGIKEGFKTFDFGKTDFDNKGLRNFKLGWGAKEYDNIFSYFPAIKSHNLFDVIKEKVIVPIIKMSPGIVCQFFGEVGYKFFPSL